jgi:phosphoglycerate kinase
MLFKRKKNIKNIGVSGRVVLVRCDFNVSLDENGKVANDTRIKQALPTINYLIKKKAKVVLLSHFGSSEKSIYPVKEKLEELLRKDVFFVGDCIGEAVQERVEKMIGGEVLLLENVRMYYEEKDGSLDFAKKLASAAEIFVNDAFSVSHRDHASVTKIPLFLPSVKGFLMEKEIRILDKVKEDPKRPVVVIIGGAKIESKIAVVSYFLKNADHVLLGGKIANMVLLVKGITTNLSYPNEEVREIVKKIDYTSSKLHIPVDTIASIDNTGERGVREVAPAKISDKEDVLDIGSETIKLYSKIIEEAGTIIWAGPLGFSEVKAFEKGTIGVGAAVAKNKKALKVIGGGDTGAAMQRFGILDKIDLVSYGGGAMLAYLSKGSLPGIDALE